MFEKYVRLCGKDGGKLKISIVWEMVIDTASYFFNQFDMELKHFSLFAIFILFLNIFGFHLCDHAVAFLFSSSNHDSHSADLDTPGNYQESLIGFKLLADIFYRLVHVNEVLSFNGLQFYSLLCHHSPIIMIWKIF